jgi:hypothetical protein
MCAIIRTNSVAVMFAVYAPVDLLELIADLPDFVKPVELRKFALRNHDPGKFDPRARLRWSVQLSFRARSGLGTGGNSRLAISSLPHTLARSHAVLPKELRSAGFAPCSSRFSTTQ